MPSDLVDGPELPFLDSDACVEGAACQAPLVRQQNADGRFLCCPFLVPRPGTGGDPASPPSR